MVSLKVVNKDNKRPWWIFAYIFTATIATALFTWINFKIQPKFNGTIYIHMQSKCIFMKTLKISYSYNTICTWFSSQNGGWTNGVVVFFYRKYQQRRTKRMRNLEKLCNATNFPSHIKRMKNKKSIKMVAFIRNSMVSQERKTWLVTFNSIRG